MSIFDIPELARLVHDLPRAERLDLYRELEALGLAHEIVEALRDLEEDGP